MMAVICFSLDELRLTTDALCTIYILTKYTNVLICILRSWEFFQKKPYNIIDLYQINPKIYEHAFFFQTSIHKKIRVN